MDTDAYSVVRGLMNSLKKDHPGFYDEASLRMTITSMAAVSATPLSDHETERLVRELLQLRSVSSEKGQVLRERSFKPWLSEQRSQSIEWHRGNAYREWLLSTGFPPAAVETMDIDVRAILGLLGDPESDHPFDRRGLILGDVQSGKTSNYLALLGKAADAGYRLIVVLAGQTDRLRKQTQERLDEGFIGRRSAMDKASVTFGIGERADLPPVQGLTSVESDFNSQKLKGMNISLTADVIHCVVLKKNKAVLDAFQSWLNRQSQKLRDTIPFLLLDDESDYASVNTRNINEPELDPTAINAAIRKLLDTFAKSSYVAYTATPFANIFISDEDPSDLFPRDFIYALEAPSNYIGVERVFGRPDEELPSRVHTIEDAEDSIPLRHKGGLQVSELPESLEEALRAFAVQNAIRDLRGQVDDPRSMLINVSRFVDVHGQIEREVGNYWVGLKNAVNAHARGGRWHESPLLNALHDTHEKLFGSAEFAWEKLRHQLPNAMANITLRVYNSKMLEKDRDQKESERVIAVGGAVLSRGLTLNGLGVSYLYQSPRASDTLLQMGRWFGYRAKYEDLCHVWVDKKVANDFKRAYEAITELRENLRTMEMEGLTPRDFGLAVRYHPESLLITAANKMQATEIAERPAWIYAKVLETVRLDPSDDAVLHNRRAAENLVEALLRAHGAPMEAQSFLRWEDVDHQLVADFLHEFRGSRHEQPVLEPGSLAAFVERLGLSKFPSWDIVVFGKSGDLAPKVSLLPLRYVERSSDIANPRSGDPFLRVSKGSVRLAGSTDVRALLPAQTAATADAAWKQQTHEEPVSKIHKEEIYYERFSRPILMIYFVMPKLRDAQWTRGPITAFKVVLPGRPFPTEKERATETMFRLNSVAARQWVEENKRFDGFEGME